MNRFVLASCLCATILISPIAEAKVLHCEPLNGPLGVESFHMARRCGNPPRVFMSCLDDLGFGVTGYVDMRAIPSQVEFVVWNTMYYGFERNRGKVVMRDAGLSMHDLLPNIRGFRHHRVPSVRTRWAAFTRDSAFHRGIEEFCSIDGVSQERRCMLSVRGLTFDTDQPVTGRAVPFEVFRQCDGTDRIFPEPSSDGAVGGAQSEGGTGSGHEGTAASARSE